MIAMDDIEALYEWVPQNMEVRVVRLPRLTTTTPLFDKPITQEPSNWYHSAHTNVDRLSPKDESAVGWHNSLWSQ